MSSEGSDIELPSALPKKTNKKTPKSPSDDLLKKNEGKKEMTTNTQDPKKLTTKEMIHQALIDLKSRKGVSLYAIKKYLTEKYNVDTDKLNYIIKKYIKTAVKEGTIVQTKGIGVSGSFKLVPVKEKKKSKPKKKKLEKDGEKKPESDKPKKNKESSKKSAEKIVKSKTKSTESKSKEDKPGKLKKKMDKEKVAKEKKSGEEKEKKVKKAAKVLQTPSKKKAVMMKRKSIGSIIKPPRMKPKAKA